MMGSPAIPVWVVPDADLEKNGGNIPVLGQPATPITNPPADMLISSDADNALTEGSDGKLYVPESGGVPYKLFEAIVSVDGSYNVTVNTLGNTLGVDFVSGEVLTGYTVLSFSGPIFLDGNKIIGDCYYTNNVGNRLYVVRSTDTVLALGNEIINNTVKLWVHVYP